ncbi:MAG TPA: hypothetical protein VG937_17535 [Polyangiaceae bacterium]|nr:hypothetical protein [Polyangiaceae bacterium]
MGVLKPHLGVPVTLSLALLVGCVPDFDDDLSIVVAPRVLAVRAEPAEAKPNEVVTLSALVVDPDPLAPPAPAHFALCVDRKPLTELGPVSPACLEQSSNEPSSALISLGTGNGVTATIPNDACRLFGPSRPEPKEGEPAGRPVDPDATGGYYEPVTARVASARDLAVGAIRLRCPLPEVTQAQSIEFATRYHANKNPELSRLELLRDGEPEELEPEAASPEPTAVLAPRERITLRANWSECGSEPAATGCTGAENYVWFDPDARLIAERRESIRISWFATAGTFQSERSGRDESELEPDSDNDWTAPDVAGPVRLWVVIRDARGGQSFQSYRLEVR